ncbi:MAG: aminotransferase class V-fold PLP-dependent enzyme [SAR202 cluster bacterium]|nr:aminotransferase class V-fold PLP-dependent enzyme [SAR202 cluster bacterium]
MLLTQNTTEGINIVMSGLPWEPGDEVITCDLEHVSITAPILLASLNRGVKLRVVQVSTDDTQLTIARKFAAAVTPSTRMVFISHVQYSSGLRMPVREIGRLARSRALWYLVDGAQAAGHIPVDARDIGCDAYAMPGQKWLLGPDGTGALYVRKEMALQIQSNAAGYESIEAFEFPAGHKLRTKDAAKFGASTTSAPLRAGYIEGLRFVTSFGIENVERRNLALAAGLRAQLLAIPGVTVTSRFEGPECTGLVTFTLNGMVPSDLVARLWGGHNILVRKVPYPAAVRVSCHFFNTEEEVGKLAWTVRKVAGA